jgi:uncharacterized repeat protein (TIGR01451 family)
LAKSRKDDLTTPNLGRLFGRFVAGMLLVAFGMLAIVSTASADYSDQLRRYPYLTDAVDNSATLNWGTTRLSISGVVRYGEAGTESCTAHTASTTRTAITVGTEPQFQWKSQLTLQPDTEYCYRIYIDTNPEIDLLGDDPSPSFRTQIPAGASDPFSFAVFGDWGEVLNADGTNPDQANLMGQIASSGARFAVTTGDNAYPAGSQTSYGDLVKTGPDTSGVFGPEFWTKPGRSIPIFPAIGNHGFAGGTSHFTNFPQESAVAGSAGRYLRETYCCENGSTSALYPSAWYAFDAGNARFYVLESAWTPTNIGASDEYGMDYAYHWARDSEQYRWLQNDLATHPRALKFAFGHYPMYSDNEHESSDPYLRGPDSLEGLLNRYGVDLAFSGHAHAYQRNAANGPGGLPNYLTGGGGAHLQSIGTDGCSAVDQYGIGWSPSDSEGSACGAAPVPTEAAQVYHFLQVGVNGSGVTVTPTDEHGRAFDTQAFSHSTSHSDLSLGISDSPDPALVGTPYTYTLEARNDGPDGVSGVVVTDKLPPAVSYGSANPTQGSCEESTGTITCSLGTIASGGAASVEIEVTPGSNGTVTNEASVVGDDLEDPNTANNSGSEETQVGDSADLSITKADSADPVQAGDALSYSIAVHNGGPKDATGVTVTDELPAGVTYQSATSSQGTCSEAGGTVTCQLGALANGADAGETINVIASGSGTITNTATVEGDQGDPDSGNNSSGEETTVSSAADLAITKSDSPDPIYTGQTLTYSIAVHNNGPSGSSSVTVTDDLPAGVTYQSATASQGTCVLATGTVSCDLGALADEGDASIEIKVTPNSSGTITNTAKVTGDGTIDPVSSNDTASTTTTVGASADLALWIGDLPDPTYLGESLYYGMLVKNKGPNDATGVTVTDSLPAGVTYEGAASSGGSGSCFQSLPGIVTCNLGDIPADKWGWVVVKVKAQRLGTITNYASVAGGQADPDSANNSASEETTVKPSADVAVTQTDSPDPVIAGNTLTYTINVKNNGPSPATGVVLTDTLPGDATFQSATSTQGSCSRSGQKVTCNIGTLASGASKTVTVKVTPTKHSTTISNKVTGYATEHDPSGGNNSSTASTKVNK